MMENVILVSVNKAMMENMTLVSVNKALMENMILVSVNKALIPHTDCPTHSYQHSSSLHGVPIELFQLIYNKSYSNQTYELDLTTTKVKRH